MGEKRNNPGDPEKSIKTGIFLAAPKEQTGLLYISRNLKWQRLDEALVERYVIYRLVIIHMANNFFSWFKL